MSKYTDILKKYWGYSSFRPLQEDIIRSADEGNDTLALLPTGGGKSITFQVPALAREGVCVVVTPLIALMKDQVDNLKKTGIRAVAVYSGLSKREIEIALDNCVHGGTKFLYVSPERLGTELFLAKLEQMNVCLLAVDEAHCISQWGYDFRPSYLKIADVRQHLPSVPVLAVTATATPAVVDDIQEKLLFKQKNVFKKSFERKNLAYIVRKVDDKLSYLLTIVNKTPGSGVVYVRSRKKTREYADFLRQHNISADYYHAGLDNKLREYKQQQWKSGQCRIIVSTNAFGMGIDKADVRFVVHMDIPDSIEAYFQEAGRGGRDLQQAYGVLLYNDADISNLQQRIVTSFPEIAIIKNIYQALGNYYQLPTGGGKGMSLDFRIFDFCKRYSLQATVVHSSLKILQNEGYIEFTEDLFMPTRINFKIGREDLYKLQVANAKFDYFIKLLLRNYTGLFTDYVPVNEEFIAAQAKTTVDVVKQYLQKLAQADIIAYIPQKNNPMLTFTEERLDTKSIRLSPENHLFLKNRFKQQVESVVDFVTATNRCRSAMLLKYFGQKKPPLCGQCDYCREKNEDGVSNYQFHTITDKITAQLQIEQTSLDALIMLFENTIADGKIITVLQWMLDNNKVHPIAPNSDVYKLPN